MASGGYGNVFFLSTNAMGSNTCFRFGKYIKKGLFANPLHSDSPTCVPRSGEHQAKLTLMSESLRNDGRIWCLRNLEDVKSIRGQIQTYRHKRRR